MATDRVIKLRRPAQLQRERPKVGAVPKPRGRTGMVPPGTKGIYDNNPSIRASVARAMVARRSLVDVQCEAEGCVDLATGQPKIFVSRMVGGKPERRGCCQAHRLRIWRKDMREKGYRQVTVDGLVGWMTPDGVFYPNPSQPTRHRLGSRKRKARNPQGRQAAEVHTESE
jgi:hypothetical protein